MQLILDKIKIKIQSKQSVMEFARLSKGHHNKARKCFGDNFSAKVKR